MPFIDRLVFSIEKERIPQKTKFLQGYYDNPEPQRFDWLLDFDYDVKNSEEIAKLFRERGIQMPRTLEISNWYVGFNWLDPVVGKGATPEQQVKNRKLRQALSIAVELGRVRARVREQGERRTGDERSAARCVRLSERRHQPHRVRRRRRRAQAQATRGGAAACSPRPATPTAATPRAAARWCSTTTTSAC